MKYRYYFHCIPKEEGFHTTNEIAILLNSVDKDMEKNTLQEVRDGIISTLSTHGWGLNIPLSSKSQIKITAQKKETALCLQTGNISRVYADLMKLQALYLNGTVSSGYLIIPVRDSAIRHGSNLANFERVTTEMTIFDRVISIPLRIIGLI